MLQMQVDTQKTEVMWGKTEFKDISENKITVSAPPSTEARDFCNVCDFA